MKKIASSLFAFALLGLAFACTSTTTTTTSDPVDGGGDAGKAGTSDAGKKDSGGGSSNDDDDDTDTETTCADEASSESCINCCADAHQAGAALYDETLVTCVCKAANCGEACGDTLCGETPAAPNAACNTCIDEKINNCEADLQEKCGADQDCVAFNNCVVESGCPDK